MAYLILVEPRWAGERAPFCPQRREKMEFLAGENERAIMKEGAEPRLRKKSAMGDTYSLLRLSNPEKAPLVSSIVPEMSLWSSSLWRGRKEGDERERWKEERDRDRLRPR